MFIFHLLSGYRGSGKDSFYYSISQNLELEFTILKDPSKTLKNNIFTDSYVCDTHKFSKSTRIGLADEVKTLVHEELGIKMTNTSLVDLAKNHLHFYDKISGEYVPLRNFYIKTGMTMRAIDPDFWCKKGLEQLLKKFPEGIDSEEIINVFITDYRFPNEKTYFEKYGKVITYRIFSASVNGSNTIGEESEHSLDNEIMDYLVLRSLNDFEDAKKIFPYYENYTGIFSLNSKIIL